jgi:hypothetical protein
MSGKTSSLLDEIALRSTAETQLREGTAPPNRGWTIGGEALASLHQLASNQSSAADALKFLHELQVYQVEIELQAEQLEQHRAELAEQLSRYVELYNRVPTGLLSADADGLIADANPRAAALLHVEEEHLPGRHLASFLVAASRPTLASLLAKLSARDEEQSCVVRGEQAVDASSLLRLTATRSGDGQSRLFSLTEVTPGASLSEG